MDRRWEFRRYDHRRNGISYSRGFLHYVGLGPVLFVWGFHRASLRRKPSLWVEFTLYVGERIDWSVYPTMRIPERWL